MAYIEKTCATEGCDVVFMGRQNQKHCTDLCRWKHHAMKKAKTASERGKSNRRKGAAAEREVCHIINELTGHDIKRNLSQTRDAGSDVRWGPFLFEVKYQQTYALPAWQRQVMKACEAEMDSPVPAVVYRRPGEEFWVSLPFSAFIAMFETLRRAAESKQT